MTGPTGNNEDCFPLPRNGNKKNSYNLMKVTVHLSLFCFIRMLLLFAQSRVAWCTDSSELNATNEQILSRNRRLC